MHNLQTAKINWSARLGAWAWGVDGVTILQHKKTIMLQNFTKGRV